MAKIFSVANQKGGVGKTTTSVNLATGLALNGHNVLLVDCDPQGNSTTGLGLEKRHLTSCLYDYFAGREALDKIVRNTNINRLKVLPASVRLASAEVELLAQDSREYLLNKGLMELAPNYDFIIIDCPPGLGLLTVNALTAAHYVLVPMQAEYYAMEGLGQLLETMDLIQKNLNPSLTLMGIVFTMFDRRTKLSRRVAEEVRKHFSGKVFETTIPRSVRLSESPSHGKPIFLYDPYSLGANAYEKLTKEVLKNVYN